MGDWKLDQFMELSTSMRVSCTVGGMSKRECLSGMSEVNLKEGGMEEGKEGRKEGKNIRRKCGVSDG